MVKKMSSNESNTNTNNKLTAHTEKMSHSDKERVTNEDASTEALQAKIRTLEHELNTVKKEFKDFSYIVSHDLNAPLRHIDFFTKRIFNQKNTDSPKDNNEDKDIVINAVDKAKHLLSLVHAFSRLATQENDIKREPIDLQVLVQDVFNNVIEEKKMLGVTFNPVGLPEFMGDKGLIKTLFKHVLDNALTYVLPDTPPNININTDIKNNVLTILISDNGIGIEEKHVDAIFVLLRRAVLAKDYAGDGVGLTMARKIAHLHGGDLALQSSKPYNKDVKGYHGSVFLLTLPVYEKSM